MPEDDFINEQAETQPSKNPGEVPDVIDASDLHVRDLAKPNDYDIIMKKEGMTQITAQLQDEKVRTVQALYNIGGLLNKAKAILKHGELVTWYTRQGFATKEAERYMTLAREYSDLSVVNQVGYSRALKLAELPIEERKNFIGKAHDINGKEKYVFSMSVAELTPLVNAKKKELHPAAKRKSTRPKKQTPSDGGTAVVVSDEGICKSTSALQSVTLFDSLCDLLLPQFDKLDGAESIEIDAEVVLEARRIMALITNKMHE